MRARIPACAALALIWLATPAWADPETEAASDPPEREESTVPLGDATRAWLERQRSGTEESRNPHGLTAPEEHRARARYLDSFTHPIPPLFEGFEEGLSEDD